MQLVLPHFGIHLTLLATLCLILVNVTQVPLCPTQFDSWNSDIIRLCCVFVLTTHLKWYPIQFLPPSPIVIHHIRRLDESIVSSSESRFSFHHCRAIFIFFEFSDQCAMKKSWETFILLYMVGCFYWFKLFHLTRLDLFERQEVFRYKGNRYLLLLQRENYQMTPKTFRYYNITPKIF